MPGFVIGFLDRINTLLEELDPRHPMFKKVVQFAFGEGQEYSKSREIVRDMVSWRFLKAGHSGSDYRWILRSWGLSSSIIARVEELRGDKVWSKRMHLQSIELDARFWSFWERWQVGNEVDS